MSNETVKLGEKIRFSKDMMIPLSLMESIRQNFSFLTPGDQEFENKYLRCLYSSRTIREMGAGMRGLIWDAVVETIEETSQRNYQTDNSKLAAMNRIFNNKLYKRGFEIRRRIT